MSIERSIARYLLLPTLTVMLGCTPVASGPVNPAPPADSQPGPSSPAQAEIVRSDATRQRSPDVPPEDLQVLAAGNPASAVDLD